jgi:hypothetical protein
MKGGSVPALVQQAQPTPKRHSATRRDRCCFERVSHLPWASIRNPAVSGPALALPPAFASRGRLAVAGLTVKTMAKQPAPARAASAKELATKTIEKIIDPAAPPEERAQRRRRLTKGPLPDR